MILTELGTALIVLLVVMRALKFVLCYQTGSCKQGKNGG